MWHGNSLFLLKHLILKDFRLRYRNMSLGIFWSLLNPLIMMAVLWFVFTKIFPNRIANFPAFVLCGLVPFNFFAIAWVSGTCSLTDSGGLLKRVPFPREIVPLASVLSNSAHLVIQLFLLLAIVLASGKGVNIHWLWIPVVWGFEIIFLSGLAFLFSGINVYIRDTRYLVESANTLLFWVVPIFYDFSSVPARYRDIYQFNPVAALVLALRNILLEGKEPPATLLWKLAFSSTIVLVLGFAVFQPLKRRFFNHL